MTLYHLRKHWKKYLVGQVVGMLLTSYLTRKLRERNVIREYCHTAKVFGDKHSSMLERPKKIYVFLNLAADNSDAKIKFNKYAAPLLHLSGLDVTVVESEYQGHIQELMRYVDPRSDGIIVAGGDGTVMEVLNGLLQRQDADVARHMVMGILPLGKNNHTFNSLFPAAESRNKARRIGEATMRILHGMTRQIPVLEIHPEKGRAKFALSSVEWGGFRDAVRHKDRFWVFGKLRLLASHVSTVLRNWPEVTAESAWTFHSPYVSFTPALVSRPVPATDPPSASSPPQARGPCSTLKEDVLGFKVTPSSSRDGGARLTLTLRPLDFFTKSAFLSHGWCLTRRAQCELPGTQYSGLHLSFIPPPDIVHRRHGDSGQQLSVDGEDFETVAMELTVRDNHITVFT